MMKNHCDRCEVLLNENCPSWIEIDKKIYHFHIEINSKNKEGEFCFDCLIIITGEYIAKIKSINSSDINIAK